MKLALVIATLLIPQISMAMNHEGQLDGSRERGAVKDFEKESKLQRDILGRKVVISPNSKIEENSLILDVAPWSTVILNVQQSDKGTQTTRTPFYRNVELPK